MPPGSSRWTRRADARRRGQDGRGDGALVDLGTEPACAGQAIRTRVGSEHLVAAQDQHLDPETPDRSGTDDEHPAGRHELCRTQHTRERLDPDAVVVAHRVGQRHAMARAQLLGEATGGDPQLAKLAAGGLVAGEAALARAARDAVHHRHARTVLELARDFVTEHRARRGAAELLDVRAAEATRLHTHEQPRAGRLRDVGQLRQAVGVENDRAHRPIVGGARGRSGSSG